MRCPFGEEVGDPPSLVRCPRGFPGCACADEWMFDNTGQGTEQTETVMDWWKEHDAL